MSDVTLITEIDMAPYYRVHANKADAARAAAGDWRKLNPRFKKVAFEASFDAPILRVLIKEPPHE